MRFGNPKKSVEATLFLVVRGLAGTTQGCILASRKSTLRKSVSWLLEDWQELFRDEFWQPKKNEFRQSFSWLLGDWQGFLRDAFWQPERTHFGNPFLGC